MEWVDNTTNKPITTPPDSTHGFIYLIEYEDGTAYIGKKNFYKTVTLPAFKSGKQRPNSTRIGRNKNGKRVYFDVLQRESDWLTYEGSLDKSNLPSIKCKWVLAYAKDKRELTYLETKYLFCYEVLESTEYRNENILGKFYKSKELL